VDQDQLNPYLAYEGYVARVPHNPLTCVSGTEYLLQKGLRPGEYESVDYFLLNPEGQTGFVPVTFLVSFPATQVIVSPFEVDGAIGVVVVGVLEVTALLISIGLKFLVFTLE